METKNITGALAKALQIDAHEVNALNAAFAQALKDYAAQLDTVSIPGFGSFASCKHVERVVVEDGKRVLLPPSIEMKFRPSVVLRKRLLKK